MRTSTRRMMGAALLGVLLAPFMMFTATTAVYAATGSDVASVASSQLGHGPCQSDSPYNGTGYGSSCSGEDWCADFAKWVWAMAGISVPSSLTPYVPDWTHSTGTHTWHPYGDGYTPHVGDAIIFAIPTRAPVQPAHRAPTSPSLRRFQVTVSRRSAATRTPPPRTTSSAKIGSPRPQAGTETQSWDI